MTITAILKMPENTAIASGNIEGISRIVDLKTSMHVRDILCARRKFYGIQGRTLCKEHFLAGDSSVYTQYNGVPYLHIAPSYYNMLFSTNSSIPDVPLRTVDTILKDKNLLTDMLNDKHTLSINLESMADKYLNNGSKRNAELIINTDGKNNFSESQTRLVEHFYGSGSDLKDNLSMLAENNIAMTTIGIYTPEYILSATKHNTAIISPCIIYGQDNVTQSRITTRGILVAGYAQVWAKLRKNISVNYFNIF